MQVLLPVVFALIAAVGNAAFAISQKRAIGISNPLLFIAISAAIATILSVVVSPVFGKWNTSGFSWAQLLVALLGGVGLFLTYLGFNLLYTRYGATSYVLYAVLSIITTTLIVGKLYSKEPWNNFHWAAVFCAFLAVIFFTLAKR
jgi:drug/metabolite transporter (DMT)-like permease